MPDIARERLGAQWLERPSAGSAGDVVRALLAVQAQDYAGGKWSIGLRLRGATDAGLEAMLDAGTLLRTHVLRPTWHFVRPDDIRWLLAATAPRVIARNAPTARRLGLDARTLARAMDAIARAVEGGRWRTREELGTALERAKVTPARGQRLTYLVMQAELEALIVSGPRRGKQFTYGLLEERAPRPPRRKAAADGATDAELLARIAARYFAGHGPATVRDLARWATLTQAAAARGAEDAGGALEREVIGGETWYRGNDRVPRPARTKARGAHLLSVFDEYVNGYHERSMIMASAHGREIVGRGNAVLHVYVVGGQVLGSWTRTFTRDQVRISLDPFGRGADRGALVRTLRPAAEEYGRFLGLEPVIESAPKPMPGPRGA
jgi:hypothetical protein